MRSGADTCVGTRLPRLCPPCPGLCRSWFAARAGPSSLSRGLQPLRVLVLHTEPQLRPGPRCGGSPLPPSQRVLRTSEWPLSWGPGEVAGRGWLSPGLLGLQGITPTSGSTPGRALRAWGQGLSAGGAAAGQCADSPPWRGGPRRLPRVPWTQVNTVAGRLGPACWRGVMLRPLTPSAGGRRHCGQKTGAQPAASRVSGQ